MSGHSHWAGIKHKKGVEDAKRGKVFSKLARIITIAAKEGGDPAMNPKLKDAIDYARSFNLPKENIERAIKKGTGEIEGAVFEPYTLEAYGPDGIPVIIEITTDNKNRALAELRSILTRYNGKIAGEGSVRWMFEQKGVVVLKLLVDQDEHTKESWELKAIDAGADDTQWGENGTLEIYTKPELLQRVEETLTKEGGMSESTRLEWVSKEEHHIENDEIKKKLRRLFEELDEHDDVQEIYSNVAL